MRSNVEYENIPNFSDFEVKFPNTEAFKFKMMDNDEELE